MVIKECRLTGGGLCKVTPDNMFFSFPAPRTALSTGAGGGLGKYSGLFNQRLPKGIVMESDLPGGSVEAYMAGVALRLACPGASGLLTSARMECYGHAVVFADGLSVEVFATGGVEGNAARAGEEPQYREVDGGFQPIGGTINIFAFLSFALSPGTLARALITVTEAKSAVLAELGVHSICGGYTATGTGTDGAVIVMDDAGREYRDIGTHSETGFLLAQAVKQAVAQTLANECYWTRGSQLTAKRVLCRMARTKKEYNELNRRFAALSFDSQEELLTGLSFWQAVKERQEWGGVPDSACGELYGELLRRYPLLKEWIK